MVTRRDCSAITKKTRYRWSPASVSTSTVNRSQAVRPSQGACRNVFQGMRRLRSGAGSIPWSCRIRVTVVRAISWPRFESAPRIRVSPHWGCSTAIRTTTAATSRRGIGQPRPRRALPSYVWAINFGVVARIVTGPHDANRQDPHLPMRYDTGRPRAVIRLRIAQPRTTSLPCPAGLRARRPSPMMDL